MRKLTAISALAAFGFMSCGASAVTYYVASSGSDSNPGSQSEPWGTVQKGIDSAQAGDNILVGEGTYDEVLVTARSGASDQRIVLDGQGLATIERITLKHSYITLKGFRISGNTAQFSAMVKLGLGAHHCILSANVVDPNRALKVQGIAWDVGSSSPPYDPAAASNCTLVSNTITRVLGAVCISIGGQNNLVLGNTITNVYQVDIFRLWGRNNTIRRNFAADHFDDPSTGFHMDWIQTFGANGLGSEGHLLEQNVAMNMPKCQLTQIEPDGVAEIRNWTFRNNIFSGIANGSTISIPGTVWYNNLFFGCNTNSSPTYSGAHALNFGVDPEGGQADGTIVKNNIFIDCGDGRDTVGWYSFNVALTNVQADWNFATKHYLAVHAGSNPVGSPERVNKDNFAFYEENGINGGNPLFVDEARRNFRLQPDSPLEGRGVAIAGFSNDADGNVRPQGSGWDIGAYEITGGIVDTKPEPPTRLQVLDE